MHCVIRRYAGNELTKLLMDRTEDVRREISSVPGLRGYYLIDGGSELASVTVCEDQACSKESTRRAAEWIKNNVPNAEKMPKPQITEGKTMLEISQPMLAAR